MKLRVPLSTLCLFVAVVALFIAVFLLTARHNAQLMEMTRRHNAQLEEFTARFNAQLLDQTARHNAELAALTVRYNAQLSGKTAVLTKERSIDPPKAALPDSAR
jgi:hypothetical protein